MFRKSKAVEGRGETAAAMVLQTPMTGRAAGQLWTSGHTDESVDKEREGGLSGSIAGSGPAAPDARLFLLTLGSLLRQQRSANLSSSILVRLDVLLQEEEG